MTSDPDPATEEVEILKIMLNDAHELMRRAQRKARYLQQELDREIARRRQLEAEIRELNEKLSRSLVGQPPASKP